jgi:hypothetical protein
MVRVEGRTATREILNIRVIRGKKSKSLRSDPAVRNPPALIPSAVTKPPDEKTIPGWYLQNDSPTLFT